LELALLKMKRRRPWSPEDDRQLLDLVENEGKSRHAAAAALKRSKSAVDNRLRVLRASSPVSKESVLDQ
jgi:predicted transcriptional regulator